eukprot:TRINITY_DN26084_c0_g1_i2.p1 TRINITY_DN26084_c0_g1~~TRINITY_DN26084_c0_g1_i2.p1  ORF type:complete len:337 (-),score=53.97 TRINITY_DN26084_c0_g1_i2:37-1047(-)
MENCIVVDGLPCQLSEEEWEELLNEEPATCSAGILTVEAIPSIDDHVIGLALLIELMLENETEIVASQLASWLPSRVAELSKMPTTDVRVRPLALLPCEVPAASVVSLASVSCSAIRFGVPFGAIADMKPLRLSMERHHADRGTGSRLWPGSLLLAEWLWQNHCTGERQIVREKRVIELGAGFCGLPARVAMASGAKEVLATDGVMSVVDMLSHNIGQSGASVRRLRWSEDEIGAWDVVLFSDCLYSARGTQLLLDCLRQCMEQSAKDLTIHGTLQPGDRAGQQDFLRGMELLGFLGEREVVPHALETAVLGYLPKDECQDEVRGLQLWTWRPYPS